MKYLLKITFAFIVGALLFTCSNNMNDESVEVSKIVETESPTFATRASNIEENEDIIIESTTVESDKSEIIVNLDITDKKTLESLPTIQHKFVASNSDNVVEDLTNDVESVSGLYTIEFENQII